jgi:hypothetical protein
MAGPPMRSLVCLVAFIASLAAAKADDVRAVPAVGSRLTYRFVTTNAMPRLKITVGEIYTYIVTAGDAASAEGIIKPVAMIIPCRGGADNPTCHAALQTPGAHLDGELLTVPIAGDVGDALAKLSHFKMTYMIQEERKSPLPGPRDLKHPNYGDIGPEPQMVLTDTMHCDLAGLPSFLPVGAAAHVALPCERRFERSATRDGRYPAQSLSGKLSYDISYTGNGSVTLPSGQWEVKKLAVKMIPDDTKEAGTEGEILFSPKLGTAVKTHMTGHNAATQATSESTSELISVAP